MSERPWWFPTAVLVAPACAAVFALAFLVEAAGYQVWWPLLPVIVFAVPLWPFIDLARREGRQRASLRPVATSPWPAGADGRTIVVDAAVCLGLLVWFLGGVMLGYGISVAMGWENGPFLGVWTLAVVGTIAVAGGFIKRWRKWRSSMDLVRWSSLVGRRWPVTFGVLSLLFGLGGIGAAAWSVNDREYWVALFIVWGSVGVLHSAWRLLHDPDQALASSV